MNRCKVLLIVLGPILGLSLAACQNGWQEDPFATYPESIRKGEVPGGKPKPEPVRPDIVFIDYNKMYDLVEDIEAKINFGVRFTQEGCTIKRFEVEHVTELLPGSSFDEQNLQISWRPSTDFVLGGSWDKRIETRIILQAETAEGLPITRIEDVTFVVRRKNEGPQIIDIRNFPAELKEGYKRDFLVEVKDMESLGDKNTEAKSPRLRVESISALQDGTPYIRIDQSAEAMPGKAGHWLFSGKVDLSSKEITNNYENFKVSFRAYNQFGASSSAENKTYKVSTSLSDPQTTWVDPVQFEVNKRTRFHFAVFDPKSEGKEVSALWKTTCGTLPGPPMCSCERASRSVNNCYVDWQPVTTGSFKFNLELYNELNSGNRTTNTVTREIKVVR